MRQESKINPNTLISVMSITPGLVGFDAPSYRYQLVFKKSGQIVKIKFEMLQDAMHLDNGYILNNNLIVMDEEARQELGLSNDIEYKLTLSQVKQIILHGTLEELRDLFTYGPEGYAMFAAELAAKEKFDSTSKLELIKKFSGIDVAFQIKNEIGIGALEDSIAKGADPSKTRSYETVEEKVKDSIADDDNSEE